MSNGFLGCPLATIGGVPPSGACGEKPIETDRLPGSVERNWLRKSAPPELGKPRAGEPSPENDDRIIFRSRPAPGAGGRRSPAPKNDPRSLTLRLAMGGFFRRNETVRFVIEVIVIRDLVKLLVVGANRVLCSRLIKISADTPSCPLVVFHEP